MRAKEAYITIKTFTQSDTEPFMIATGLWSPSSSPAQGQWARQCSKRPGLAVDKCLPRATAPNNPLSLIPAAPSQLYKLLTAHPVNPVAEWAVKLHPPSKQHSKLPSLYNMMGPKTVISLYRLLKLSLIHCGDEVPPPHPPPSATLFLKSCFHQQPVRLGGKG